MMTAIPSMTPNETNNYFASVLRKTPSQKSVHQVAAVPLVNSTDLFVLSPIYPETLLQAWKKMKKMGNLTLDPLGMNNLMFDFYLKSDSFLTRLVSIFNSCIQNEYFPDILKTAKFQLRKYLILSYAQFLFSLLLQNCLRSVNFSNFLAVIYDCLDKNEVCVLVTFDIRKAFDRVDRDVTYHKLLSYNIDPAFFLSYLSNKSHFVSMTHNNITIQSDKTETELLVL
jgi:hypothetical protein